MLIASRMSLLFQNSHVDRAKRYYIYTNPCAYININDLILASPTPIQYHFNVLPYIICNFYQDKSYSHFLQSIQLLDQLWVVSTLLAHVPIRIKFTNQGLCASCFQSYCIKSKHCQRTFILIYESFLSPGTALGRKSNALNVN